MSDIQATASVTPPLAITDAVLTSCTVAEPDTSVGEAAYNAGHTYAKGDQAISTTTHLIYESTVNGNVGNAFPAGDTVGDSNDFWLIVGPTNRWRALDLYGDTATTGASPLTYVLTPGKRVNTIALDGLVGDSITLTQKKAGVVIWTYTQSLTARNTTTWTEYLIGEFRQVPMVFRQDILPVSGTTITISVTRASGQPAIGMLLIGTRVDLGETEVKPQSDSLNFSSFTRDIGGRAQLVPRRSVPKTSQTIWCDKGVVPKLKQTRDDLDATPAFWAGLSDGTDSFFSSLALFGVYTRWLIVPDEGDVASQQLELEGY